MPIRNYIFTDQLVDVEIDFTKYLTNFSDDNYTLEFRNIQPVKATLKDIFSFLDLLPDYKDRGTSFRQYIVKEGELPEDVALRFYGSEDYWWVICLFNDIKNPLTDWPLTEEQINYLADLLSSKEDKYDRDSYYTLLFEENNIKKELEILKNAQVFTLIDQFRNSVIVENLLTGTTLSI